MKILNLYAGLGGNRELWGNHEVTAIELDPEVARIYQEKFPNDTVWMTDAHSYLLKYFQEYDFIWSSPPCPTHSRGRYWKHGQDLPVYPDMKLYEEILLLKHYFKGQWVVENVVSYYKPLMRAVKIGRHYFWSNFQIHSIEGYKSPDTLNVTTKGLDYSGDQRKDKLIRNTMDPELGLHIMKCSQLKQYELWK